MAKSRTALDLRIEIADLYDGGNFVGRCTVDDMAGRMGARRQSVSRAFQALGFTRATRQKSVRENGKRKPTKIPAQWEPPNKWPELFTLQRQLRKAGVSAGATLRATDAAANEADILESAIGALLLNDVPVSKRGALKAQIKEVIRSERREYKTRSIALVELAERLRESPYMGKDALLNRVDGLLRAATRKARV